MSQFVTSDFKMNMKLILIEGIPLFLSKSLQHFFLRNFSCITNEISPDSMIQGFPLRDGNGSDNIG